MAFVLTDDFCNISSPKGRVIDSSRTAFSSSGIGIGCFQQVTLEFRGIFPQVVDKPEEPSPLTGPQGICKLFSKSRNFLEVFFKKFPVDDRGIWQSVSVRLPIFLGSIVRRSWLGH